MIESLGNVVYNDLTGGQSCHNWIIARTQQNLLQTKHPLPNLISDYLANIEKYDVEDNAWHLNELLNAVLGRTEDRAWGL